MAPTMRSRPSHAIVALIAATAFACLLAVSVAVAGPAGGSDGREATASASVKKKIKKLEQRAKAQEQRLAELEAEQGGSRPPSGAADGDLTGSYPGPQIAANALGTSEVANGTIQNADLAPTARGARAYGRVSGAGSLTETKNIASLTNPSTGVWCITPRGRRRDRRAEPRRDHDDEQPLDVRHSLAFSDESINTCPDTAFQVMTFEDDLTDEDLQSLNQGFSFVIP